MFSDFRPSASIKTLQARAQIIGQVRKFFDELGFFEVQTPVLSRDTVVDPYLDPIGVEIELKGQLQQFWLQTSPEFCMKRLLASGAQAIYQIGPAFRAAEVGRLHNIEFTMLEWYRVGDRYQQGMDLLDQFAQSILGRQPARRVTYRELFLEIASIDPFDGDHQHDELNRVLVEQVEPVLRDLPALIIYDWPAQQAALATTREKHGVAVAQRFELYVDGLELANGYHELTDAEELISRNRRTNQLRSGEGRGLLPDESRLLQAMRYGMPESCGVAVGFDRLVMLALGKSSLADVIAFDSSRA